MPYSSTYIQSLKKEQLLGLVSLQPDVTWPSELYTWAPPKLPTVAQLRTVLKGPYGYHPQGGPETSFVAPPSSPPSPAVPPPSPPQSPPPPSPSEQSEPTQPQAAEIRNGVDPCQEFNVHDLRSGTSQFLRTLALRDSPGPFQTQEVVDGVMAFNIAGPYRVCSSIEGSAAYRPIFTVANNQTKLLVEEVQLHDGLEFFIFADSTATLSHGVSGVGSQSSSSDSGSDSEEESDLGESRADRERRDLELLKSYVKANSKRESRIQAFRASKGRKSTDAHVVKNFQIAVSFLDKVREKTDWPDRPGKIPACTIKKFMRRAPSWFSNARGVLDALAIVGPESNTPDPAVVERLASKLPSQGDLRLFLDGRVKEARGTIH